MQQELMDQAIRITEESYANAQYPCLALDGDRPVVCWQSYRNKRDELLAAEPGGAARVLSVGGQALQPRSASACGGAWFIWSEYRQGAWSVLARRWHGGALSEPVELDRGDALFYPSIAAWKDGLAAVWCRQAGGESRVMLRTLSPQGGLGAVTELSGPGEAYRPAAVQGGDGRLYLAYDRYTQSGYTIALRTWDGASLSEEVSVGGGDWWAAAPRLAALPAGAGVVWYEVGSEARFRYRFSSLTASGEALSAGVTEEVTGSANWYNTIDLAAGPDGTLYFAYTWGKYSVHLRRRAPGRPWSAPTVLTFDDGNCAIRPSLALDRAGALHYAWQFACRNGHLARNASVFCHRVSSQWLADHEDPVVETLEDRFVAPIPGQKPIVLPPAPAREEWLRRQGQGEELLCFGDIHGHSIVSDAMGEVDQYYHYARDVRGMDLTALTDHDCYPDTLSESEWEFLRAQARLFNEPGRMAVLLGYEWTSNEYRYDFGHKNVYYPGEEGRLFRATEEDGYTPDRLFAGVRAAGGMVIPHHPSVDWALVSAATDWQFRDSQVQRLCEIFSRHADFEHYESTSPFTKNIRKIEGCSCDDALAMGLRVGFTAGSDSHQMEAGKEGGILAAFLPELTSAALFQALWDRRVYATTGTGILLLFSVNGHPMGSELALERGTALAARGRVLGTAPLTALELIRNNRVVRKIAGEGAEGALDWEEVLEESGFFYLKATQTDGHMAWSSPIWVDVQG